MNRALPRYWICSFGSSGRELLHMSIPRRDMFAMPQERQARLWTGLTLAVGEPAVEGLRPEREMSTTGRHPRP
jgi:hypothetical protein